MLWIFRIWKSYNFNKMFFFLIISKGLIILWFSFWDGQLILIFFIDNHTLSLYHEKLLFNFDLLG